MIELYHNAASTCSQKVRLVLAEKGLDYASHDIDLIGGGQHDPEYVKLNPGHVVPTLVHEGYVATESTMINEYLDDAFPAPAMRPPDAAALPYVMRLDHLAMTPLIDARAQVADWYARVRSRPSFESAIGARLPEPIVAMFRHNGEAVWPDVQQALVSA